MNGAVFGLIPFTYISFWSYIPDLILHKTAFVALQEHYLDDLQWGQDGWLALGACIKQQDTIKRIFNIGMIKSQNTWCIQNWNKLLHFSTRYFVFLLQVEGLNVLHDIRYLDVKVWSCSTMPWNPALSKVGHERTSLPRSFSCPEHKKRRR